MYCKVDLKSRRDFGRDILETAVGILVFCKNCPIGQRLLRHNYVILTKRIQHIGKIVSVDV